MTYLPHTIFPVSSTIKSARPTGDGAGEDFPDVIRFRAIGTLRKFGAPSMRLQRQEEVRQFETEPPFNIRRRTHSGNVIF